MPLDHEYVRTVLPDYLNGSLESTMHMTVSEHLAGCETCTAEMLLLEELSAVEVPDPGDLFWKTLPKRIAARAERPVPWWKKMVVSMMRPVPLAVMTAIVLAVMLVPFAMHYVGLPDQKEGIIAIEQIDIPKQQVQEIARGIAPDDQDALSMLESDDNGPAEYQQVIAALSVDELDELVQELQKSGDSGGDA